MYNLKPLAMRFLSLWVALVLLSRFCCTLTAMYVLYLVGYQIFCTRPFFRPFGFGFPLSSVIGLRAYSVACLILPLVPWAPLVGVTRSVERAALYGDFFGLVPIKAPCFQAF